MEPGNYGKLLTKINKVLVEYQDVIGLEQDGNGAWHIRPATVPTGNGTLLRKKLIKDFKKSLDNYPDITTTINNHVSSFSGSNFVKKLYFTLSNCEGIEEEVARHFPNIDLYYWLFIGEQNPLTDYLVLHNTHTAGTPDQFNRVATYLENRTSNRKFNLSDLRQALMPFRDLITNPRHPDYYPQGQYRLLDTLRSQKLEYQWKRFSDFLPNVIQMSEEPIVTKKNNHVQIIQVSHTALAAQHNHALSPRALEIAMRSLEVMCGDNFPLFERFQLLKEYDGGSEILVDSKLPCSEETIRTHITHLLGYYISNNFQSKSYNTYPGKQEVDEQLIPYIKSYYQYLSLQDNLPIKKSTNKDNKI